MAKEEKSGLSRRDFVRGSGLAAMASLAAGTMLGATGCTSSAEAIQLPKAIGHMEPNADKCAGCRNCVVACALNHGQECGPTKARLRIIQAAQNTFDASMVTCKQCDTPQCYYACQEQGVGAIYIDEDTGARVIDQDKCVGCMSCMKACPQYPNAPIFLDEDTGTCFKCDLCGGDPNCVKFCPLSASWTEHCFPAEDHPLTFTGAEPVTSYPRA